MTDIETSLSDTANETIRVPANLMALIRQSYDSREKVLDWCLAITVSCVLIYVFRTELGLLVSNDTSVNAGRDDQLVPNQDIVGAFGGGPAKPTIYSYNMPSSRTIKYRVVPHGAAIPQDPAQDPVY